MMILIIKSVFKLSENMFGAIVIKHILPALQYSISEYFNNLTVFFFLLLLITLILILIFYIRFNRRLHYSQKILKESEERFRKLSNLTFEGVVLHKNGIVVDSNESLLNMFGYKREELLDKNILTFLASSEEDVKTLQRNIKNLITKPYEIHGVKKNGEVFPVEIESRNLMLNGEEIRVAAIRDISERKKQEATLEKEQWLFSTLMNNIPDAIYFKDLESRFIRVNKHALKKFGVQKVEEILGKRDSDFFSSEHANPAYEDEQQIIKTKKPLVGLVERETWKDGTVTWASTSKLPLIDKNGKVQGTFGLTRDITKLKEAQQVAISEKEKFELLFRLVPSAVFTVDTNKVITSWNAMAEEITGYKSEEIINKKCEMCTEDPNNDVCGLYDENVAKPIVNNECKIKKKDGTIITISKNVDFVKDNEGNIVGGIESFIDISKQKQHEEEIQKYSEELTELNKSKDRFFSIIAHDLRNPFVTLLGFSEMLIEDYYDFSDEEKIGYLKEMYNTSKSSHGLLENLLQWSRSQTGRIKYEPCNLDFYELVNSNYELVKKNAQMKNIEVNIEINPNEMLFADEDMITTVMRNLLTNALKFTPNDGKITIGTKDRGEMKEIFVQDTGVGISSDRIDKIFQIDQASSTEGTNGEKGSGLGLILAKEFIEKHGGKIWVESKESQGTSFHFTIPKSN